MKPERPADRMMLVLACPWLDHARARVVAVVAFHDGSGGAVLGLRRIAREAGLGHMRNAANLLKAARRDGAIDWTAGTGKAPNTYRIDYEALWQERRSDALSATLRNGTRKPLVTRSAASSDALSATKPEEPESIRAVADGAQAPTGGDRLHGRSIGETEPVAARATDGLRAGGAPPAARSDEVRTTPPENTGGGENSTGGLPPQPPEKPAEKDNDMTAYAGERRTKLPSPYLRYCGKCNAPHEWDMHESVWRTCVVCGLHTRLYEDVDPNLPTYDGPPVPLLRKDKTGLAGEVLASTPVSENQTPCAPLDLAELHRETERLAAIACHFPDAADPECREHVELMDEHAARCISVGLPDPWAAMRIAA